MDQPKKATFVNKDLLIESTGGNQGLATRILGYARDFSGWKGKDSRISSKDSVPEEILLEMYHFQISNWRGARNVGAKSVHAMSDYLLKKGLIPVDYRFGHLPILEGSPIDSREAFSPFESARIIGNPDGEGESVEKYVYVAGIYLPNGPCLIQGPRLITGKDNESKIDGLSFTLIEDIKFYSPISVLKGRFDD